MKTLFCSIYNYPFWIILLILFIRCGEDSSTGSNDKILEPPSNIDVTSDNELNTITWSAVSNADFYNLYWSNNFTVTKNDNKIANVSSPYSHISLTNGTTYYYAVSAADSAGESELSDIKSGTPNEILEPPSNIDVTSDNELNTITWSAVSNADFYNLYWSNNFTVTKNDNKIANLSSPYSHTSLTNGTIYYYAVSAADSAGESELSDIKSGIPTHRKRWEFKTEGRITSSPALGTDGTLYVGSWDDKLYAINPDGTKKWEFQTTHDIESSPTIGTDGTVYFMSTNLLYAINPDGTKKWEFDTRESASITPAMDKDGTIFVGSRKNLYGLNPDGTQKWIFGVYGLIQISSPVIGANSTVYVGASEILYSVKTNGQFKWEFFARSTIESSSAIGTDGTVYIGSNDQRLYAVNPDKTKKWEFIAGNMIRSSPAIGKDGTIYFGSDDFKFYAINPDSTLKWEFETKDDVESSPAIGKDGTVFVGSVDNKLYAINPDGTKKWEFIAGNMIRSSPVIGKDGTVYVGSDDCKLYAIESECGGLADSPWPMFMHDPQHTGRQE